MIHAKLKKEQGFASDLLNLHALEQHLPLHMRNDFLNIDSHSPLLGYLSNLNASFVPVLNYVLCFKSEIGLCL